MAKNRRNESAALRFAPAVKAFLLCLFIAGSCIGYVWQKKQVGILGMQIKERESRLVELRRQNKLRRDQWVALCSPVALDARVKKLNLGLIPPSPTQVVRMVEGTLDTSSGPQVLARH